MTGGVRAGPGPKEGGGEAKRAGMCMAYVGGETGDQLCPHDGSVWNKSDLAELVLFVAC